MKVFLVLLFLVEGEWSLVDSFLPREFNSMAKCDFYLEQTENYMEEQNLRSITNVTCIEAKPEELNQKIKKHIEQLQ